MSFVHLHLHSQYSLLQGALRLEDMIERVKAQAMPAVAVTDTHNLFGAIDFYLQAKDAGLKSILGCEVRYLTTIPQALSREHLSYHQLVVLCKDLSGYQNLCKLLTESYKRARPDQKIPAIVDRDLLNQYGDGLVVLSGGLKGEIPYLILTGREEEAKQSVEWFKKRFGSDFYFELQDHPLPEQELVNEKLNEWSEKMGIQTVATCDPHYLVPEDAEAHEVFQCIELGRTLDFDRPKSLSPANYYVKTADEMRQSMERFPGACDRTLEIAEKCDVKFKFKDEKGRPIYHLPNFRPEGVSKTDAFDLLAYFKTQAREGLKRRFTEPLFEDKVKAADWNDGQVYHLRLEEELEMIARTGFAGYFLIVADFINWAKQNDIPVGPGRGSGAGSLVAYSLRITDIDPIEFKLLFERFINPERISMPDFDIDFCQDRRSEVIEYVGRKYGTDNVCQIITIGLLQAKAAVKDVGRVLGLSFAETDQITKLFPDELNIKLKKAIEKEVRLQERMEQDPKVAKIMAYALKLEGLCRNAGVHAAGVIITEEPVVNYCPLIVGRDGVVTTQYDKDFAEKIGLVKFDFLGLKTLTVVDTAVKLIRAGAEPGAPEASFDLTRISLRDPKVYALIGSGDTDGVFQVESSGMKDLCQRLQPNSLEDLTAINALYRPGPLGSGMVDDFIERKHGRKPIVYELPQLENILRETYGVIVYQEQVMQIARELAGYSLGQADLLRRAMGKKIAEEMAKHRGIFVEGAGKLGIPPEKAGPVFDLMEKFAEYGFNKSHSAAYGMITYQTAYLKTHYPAEFMAALMATEMDNTEKITKYIADARAHGLQILSPDVNQSLKKFSVEKLPDGKKGVRFGLEAIKGVGGVAVDLILETRAERPFDNVLDFVKRVSTRKANKKVLESLTLAGAFDSVAEVNRATLFSSLEKLIDHASDEQEERELGQSSLFDAFQAQEIKLATPSDAIFKAEEEWPVSKRLLMERQVVGFYVSGHPMEHWQKITEEWLGFTTEKIKAKGGSGPLGKKVPVRVAGILAEMKEITTKKGSRMAFVGIEDALGKIEAIFFPEAYQNQQEMIRSAMANAEPVVLTGEIDLGEETPKLLVRTMEWLEDAHRDRVNHVTLRLNPSQVSAEQLRSLKKSLIEHRGRCPVKIEFVDSQFKTELQLPKTMRVIASPELVKSVNQIFGAHVISLQ